MAVYLDVCVCTRCAVYVFVDLSVGGYEPNCILTCVCGYEPNCILMCVCVCARVCTYLLIYLSEVFIACIFSTCAYVFPSSFSPYIYYYTYIARLFTATTCKWLAITSASGVSLSCLQTTVVWSFWLFNCSILPMEWGALFTQLCKHAFQVPY